MAIYSKENLLKLWIQFCRIELFDGNGGLVEGTLLRVTKNCAVTERQTLPQTGPNWHVVAAFGNLKGGHADWLLEKCMELEVQTLTPWRLLGLEIFAVCLMLKALPQRSMTTTKKASGPRLANACTTFLEDNDHDEVCIVMALGQMEAFIKEENHQD